LGKEYILALPVYYPAAKISPVDSHIQNWLQRVFRCMMSINQSKKPISQGAIIENYRTAAVPLIHALTRMLACRFHRFSDDDRYVVFFPP
jgi:hypothetical protein